MHYKKILTAFWVLLPLSVILRILQLLFTVETKTGFFLREYETFGNIMLKAIFIFAAISALFCFTTHRCPENPPKVNVFLSIASFLLSASILIELQSETFPITVQWWLILALKLTGILSAAFFVCYGLNYFTRVNIPPLAFIVPVIYLIVRVVCDFTAISSLALISDNLILMISYCSILWFMLNFAKLYNGIDAVMSCRKLMASSTFAVILCFTQSIPHILINFITRNSYLHTSFSVNLNVLLMGVFALTFMLTHFSKTNSCN